MAFKLDLQEISTWEKITQDVYMDKHKLGEGSFGEVYRGYSKSRNTLIAIKKVLRVGQFKREIETLQSLASLKHPNIMGYYGNFTKDSITYMFLEYCPNGTLEDLINQKVTQLQALRLFRQLVQGMCYMNAKEKMHRDIKPQNILIGLQKDIKICDFGLAKGINNIFVTGQRGTPLYAAPQVFLMINHKQHKYTYNCDVWGVGLILYEILTGKRLFSTVQNFADLKNQWLAYQRGSKRVTFPENYHPLWEYFMNWLVQFDASKRPTFHQILQNIKRIYIKMESQLKQGKSRLQSQQQQTLYKYINFQKNKYLVLVDLCQHFTQQDIRIRNEFKFLCMFLSLLRYLIFVKEFIRNLRYRRIKYNNEDLIKNVEPKVQMIIDNYRLFHQQKYDFYKEQLAKTIIPKVLKDYCKRDDKITMQILHDLQQIVDLMKKYDSGQTVVNEQILPDIFKSCLEVIQKRHNTIKIFNLQQLKLYHQLLEAMLIEDLYPEKRFKDYQQVVKKLNIKDKNRDQLLQSIQKMRKQIL